MSVFWNPFALIKVRERHLPSRRWWKGQGGGGRTGWGLWEGKGKRKSDGWLGMSIVRSLLHEVSIMSNMLFLLSTSQNNY